MGARFVELLALLLARKNSECGLTPPGGTDDSSPARRFVSVWRPVPILLVVVLRPRSYRTLRDGSFEGRFPRHFVPGYDRCRPSGTRWQTFAAASWISPGAARADRSGSNNSI